MTKAQAPVPHAKDEFPTPGHPRANSECRDHLNHLQNNSMGIPHTDSTDFPFLVSTMMSCSTTEFCEKLGQ